MSGYVDLLINQGASFFATLSLRDDGGNPVLLSTYTCTSQMRKSYYSNTKIDFTCTTIDANTGSLQISLVKEQTANLDPGRYVYDVFLLSNEALAVRILEGTITVAPGVTR